MATKTRDIALNLLLVVFAVCPLVSTGLVVRRELFGSHARADSEPTRVENWRELARVGAPLGNGDGSITVVEFSDFQCPYCARVEPAIRGLRAKFPGKVRLIYRHFPLTALHPNALGAAQAAECAGEQGAFERYHDALFAEQDSIGTKSWTSFAKQAGVSRLDEFRECVRENRYSNRVQRDVRAATALGIRATPTLIVNGELYMGAVPLALLEGSARRSMAGSRWRWWSSN